MQFIKMFLRKLKVNRQTRKQELTLHCASIINVLQEISNLVPNGSSADLAMEPSAMAANKTVVSH